MMRVEGSEPDSLRMVKDQEPAAQPARGWIGRRDLADVLRLTVVVWALLLVATVGLMFCFDHDALVAADRRYLSVLQGRDVTRDEVATLYDSTLEAFDSDECFRPRERFCLDGFCSAGHWRDHRENALFPCKGDLGSGVPSFELFERALTSASALGGAVFGGLVLHAVLASCVADRHYARFATIATPVLLVHVAAGMAGTVKFFQAVEAASLVAFPHPAANIVAAAHFGAVLRNGYLLVTATLALGAAAVSRISGTTRGDSAFWRLDARDDRA